MCWDDLRKSGRSFLDASSVFRAEKGGWKAPFRFLLLLQAISSVLSVASLYVIHPIFPFSVPLSLADAPAILLADFAGFVVALLAWTAWLHLWAALLGARNGLLPTFRAVAYGSGPRFWFAWLPFVSAFFVLWAGVNTAVGLRDLQKLSPGRSAAALLLAVLTALVVIILAALLIGPDLIAL